MYRSALVALKPGAANHELLQYAVALAKNHDLLLSGEAVLDRDRVAPAEPVPLGAAAFKVERDEVFVQQAAAQIAEARTAFEAACAPAGIRYEFEQEEGALPRNLTHAAQRHDLVLLGRHAQGQEVSALEPILRVCPRPAIVIPGMPKVQGLVLAACDGSAQSARSLASFIASGLFADAEISVVSVETETGTGHAVSRLAADYLLRHGRRVQSRVVHSRSSTAEALLNAVDELQPGLVVIGAFGKPAIREFFLGSVTKELLRRLPVPVWVDH